MADFYLMLRYWRSGSRKHNFNAINGWIDKQDRVYIYFILDEVMEQLHCGREKALDFPTTVF